MEPDRADSAEIARLYYKSAAPLVPLGWGVTGDVYLSPDKRTAVKVHRRKHSFDRELYVYRKINSLRLTNILGLTIPKLRDHRHELNLLCLDFVVPPYLLDFAGVLTSTPDFSEDTMALWQAEVNDRFGPNAWIAYAVHTALAKHGLYYMDLRPSNVKLDGLPGLEPHDTSDFDDL